MTLKGLNGEHCDRREIFMQKMNQDAGTPKTDTPKNIARGGRLTKWKGKVASIAPSLLIFSTVLSVAAGGGAGIASAQTIDTPVMTPHVVATDENVLITPTGSITVDNAKQAVVFTTDFTSTAINRGTITNTVSTESGNIVTVRNEAGSAGSPASFENHGVMRATTGPAPLPGEAFGFLVLKGLQFNEDVIADITNTGEVTVDSTYHDLADVDAYLFLGDLTGDFTNSGDITATATSSEGIARANGLIAEGRVNNMDVDRNMIGDITNSGTLTATANAELEAEANAVLLSGTFTGTFLNTETGEISSTAKSAEDAATAYGVYMDEEMTSEGGITNAGDTKATATAKSDASAKTWYLNGNLTGDFTNSGSITAEAESTEDEATADSVYVSGSMTGNITNSSDITATATAEQLAATANAVRLSGTFTGTFRNTNTGEISSTAKSAGDEATAYGVYMDEEMEAKGGITNAGVTKATATAKTSASARAYYLSGDLTGNFSNTDTGRISVEANSDMTSVVASGFYVNQNMDGNFSNSGAITVTGSAERNAVVDGIDVGGTFAGDFSNTRTGTISASATSSDVEAKSSEDESAKARSVRFEGNVTTTGGITNAGTVIAHASAKTEAYARAFRFGGDLTGNISNFGTITATADGANRVVADGIYLKGTFAGDLLNAGTVAVRANAVTDATASAIYVGAPSRGMIRNTGTISTSATAQVGRVSGIYVDNEDSEQGHIGHIANFGTITVAASGGEGVETYGIYVKNHDGVISDVGRISARSENGKAYAVFLDEGSGSLNVDTHDTIQGLMHVRAHNVELDARGGTAVFFFEDSAPAEGTFTKKVSDGHSVWFTGGEGGSKPIYTVVAPIDVLTTSDVVASYGDIIGGTTDFVKPKPRNQAQNEVSRTSTSAAQHFGLNGFGRFANLSAESSEFEILKNVETNLRTYDGNIGVTGVTDGGAVFALAMGVFRAEGDTPTTKFDTDTLYLNAAYGRSFGTLDFAASLGVGWLSNEKSRQIAGSKDASANYDSTMLTAHLGVGKAFDVGQDMGLNGFGNIRFTRQADDAYTEKGSSVNAQVGKSVTKVLEATAGVEIEKQLPGKVGTLSGGVSGVFRTNLTDPDAQVRVLSTTETLTFAASDFSGANLSLGYEKELMPGMLLDFSAEQEVGTGAKGPNVRALINWSF